MCLSVYVGLHGLLITLILMILTRISQFFGVAFLNRISQKTGSIMHASRQTFPVQEALVLCITNHEIPVLMVLIIKACMHGKLPSSARLKSLIFISFLCFSLHLDENGL